MNAFAKGTMPISGVAATLLLALSAATSSWAAESASSATPARPDGTFGVDISQHQGTIDWTALAGEEVGYIFIRATYGTHVDPAFADNWGNAGAQSLPRGVYHFYRNGQHPLDQAATLIGALQMAGGLAAGDLPPVVDVENNAQYDPPLKDADDISAYVADLCAFVGEVERFLGVRPIIYTSASYWTFLGEPDGFGYHPLWVAEYGVDTPNLPQGWERYDIWQFGTWTVAGIDAPVDGNVTHEAVTDIAAMGRDPAPTDDRCGAS
jgi:lysozyme